MTLHISRTRRAIAVSAGLATAAALALLPGTASAAATGIGSVTAKAAQPTGPDLSYIVNIRPGKGNSDRVQRAIADAGGTVVQAYDQLGVIVAHSADTGFAPAIRKVSGVDSAGATRAAPLPAQSTTDVGMPKMLTAEDLKAASAKAAPGEDPLEPLQWDLKAIKADKAHEKTLGSPKVTVGVIDTGVDDTHPDIAPNFDRAKSVSCITGKPDTTDGAWRPFTTGGSPHGTHVAGEIAGAKNGIGITGVAPGVKIAAIKVATQGGSFFYTESVVCGFVWAAEHHIDVTNNSYYTDPWYFNCKNDPDQKALVEAITRASTYAESKGTVNVAAAGNENYDFAADAITDPSSPDDATPGSRVVNPRECLDIPTQLPGVVTVAATGAKGIKSSYSNYGLGFIDIAAPGGDSTAFQPPQAPATSGLILGPVPGGGWAYMAGTSMAAPHVVGVAALLKSEHPDASAWEIRALLELQADRTPCTTPYDIDGDGKVDAVCQGGKFYNGFYGAGITDALNAVTK
ncbi:S8 family peptidase [Streptomyces sp. NPDC050485]|uniref:S8 family peptidase n=1 Tax=Streptomyces sp. NPDC050485 TaxID=3365617 RepID=UPI0037A590D8